MDGGLVIRLTCHFNPITAVLTPSLAELSGLFSFKQARKFSFYRQQFAYLYNIKSIMNEAPISKHINLKELALLLDWLRTSPDRKTIVASAAQKYAPLLKNLSPEQIYSKAQNRNIKINSKQANGESKSPSSMERWDFNEYTIFVWISAYFSLKENVQLQQMTLPHFKFLHRIFANKSLLFIKYNLRNLCFLLDKKNEDWSSEETSLLLTVMREFADKPDWKLASFTLFCRSNGRFFRPVPQCRQKWFNYLNPNVKKDKWTHEQDNLLFMLIDEIGCQWSRISKNFKETRNEHSVKNRYNYFKKQWKKGNENFRPLMIAPLIKKVLLNNEYDSQQEPRSPTIKSKFCLTSKDIFHENSSSQFVPDISDSPTEKVYKNGESESQATSLEQKIKETEKSGALEKQLLMEDSEKSQTKIDVKDETCLQFDFLSYFMWMNEENKAEKRSNQMPKLLSCPEMSTSHEIEADVVRILGCSHFQAILSHEDWMERLEEDKNMEWID